MELVETRSQGLEISGGIDGLLIKDLAMAIGFDYEIHTPEDKEWGIRKEDGNWTGMLGMLDRGAVDMAASVFSVTENRFDTFTQIPYSVLQIVFVVDKPRVITDDSRFKHPFRSEVWYACVAAYLITTLVLWLMTGRKFSIPILATKTLGMTFGKYRSLRTSTATKIVSSCWVLSSMFLVFSYSAVLLSSLTLPAQEQGIKTFDDLVDAVLNHDYKVILPKETRVILEHLSRNPKFSGVTRKIIDNNWFFEMANDSHSQRFDDKSIYIGVKLDYQMAYGIEPFTSKFISEDTLFVTNIGLVLRNSFCCKKKLRWYTNRIFETGLYESYLRQTSMMSFSDRHLELEAPPFTPLSLRNMGGIFFILLFGLLLAVTVFVMEICLFYWENVIYCLNRS